MIVRPGGPGEAGANHGEGPAGGRATSAETGVTEAAVVQAAAGLGRELVARALTVATVESCTGGLLARALTETPGSSTWFDRGWVTYSNDAKTAMVGVDPETLAAHGAVSEPTAREMAHGGLLRSRAGLAIAVTGIAGPGGEVPGKPVGTVCFGWAFTGRDTLAQTLRFEGERTAVRLQAALHALQVARRMLAGGPDPEILSADPKD